MQHPEGRRKNYSSEKVDFDDVTFFSVREQNSKTVESLSSVSFCHSSVTCKAIDPERWLTRSHIGWHRIILRTKNQRGPGQRVSHFILRDLSKCQGCDLHLIDYISN